MKKLIVLMMVFVLISSMFVVAEDVPEVKDCSGFWGSVDCFLFGNSITGMASRETAEETAAREEAEEEAAREEAEETAREEAEAEEEEVVEEDTTREEEIVEELVECTDADGKDYYKKSRIIVTPKAQDTFDDLNLKDELKDTCYDFNTGTEYLIERTCNGDQPSYIQKNCAELGNYECDNGACVEIEEEVASSEFECIGSKDGDDHFAKGSISIPNFQDVPDIEELFGDHCEGVNAIWEMECGPIITKNGEFSAEGITYKYKGADKATDSTPKAKFEVVGSGEVLERPIQFIEEYGFALVGIKHEKKEFALINTGDINEDDFDLMLIGEEFDCENYDDMLCDDGICVDHELSCENSGLVLNAYDDFVTEWNTGYFHYEGADSVNDPSPKAIINPPGSDAFERSVEYDGTKAKFNFKWEGETYNFVSSSDPTKDNWDIEFVCESEEVVEDLECDNIYQKHDKFKIGSEEFKYKESDKLSNPDPGIRFKTKSKAQKTLHTEYSVNENGEFHFNFEGKTYNFVSASDTSKDDWDIQYVCGDDDEEEIELEIVEEAESEEEVEEIEYQNGVCNGCEKVDKCYPYGTRISEEFCGLSSEWDDQKPLEEDCDNNYECSSNQCTNGVCSDLAAQLEEAEGLIQQLLDYLKQLFGFEIEEEGHPYIIEEDFGVVDYAEIEYHNYVKGIEGYSGESYAGEYSDEFFALVEVYDQEISLGKYVDLLKTMDQGEGWDTEKEGGVYLYCTNGNFDRFVCSWVSNNLLVAVAIDDGFQEIEESDGLFDAFEDMVIAYVEKHPSTITEPIQESDGFGGGGESLNELVCDDIVIIKHKEQFTTPDGDVFEYNSANKTGPNNMGENNPKVNIGNLQTGETLDYPIQVIGKVGFIFEYKGKTYNFVNASKAYKNDFDLMYVCDEVLGEDTCDGVDNDGDGWVDKTVVTVDGTVVLNESEYNNYANQGIHMIVTADCTTDDNCGGFEQACGINSYCLVDSESTNGANCVCDNGWKNCQDNDGSLACDNYIATDSNNCGACGVVCGSGECVNGACVE